MMSVPRSPADSASDSPIRGIAAAGLTLPPLVQRVLAARGFNDPQQIHDFCEPKLTHLHDTALLPNIDPAARRIVEAIRRNEMIVIYGDYDVDGITATAILYHTIKTVQPAARLRTYVPHRLEEGYGLNCEALRQLKSDGADLVITVDCGVTAIKSAQTAKTIGLDLIITDHHEAPHTPAHSITNGGSDAKERHLGVDAFAQLGVCVVHPRLPGSQYPFGELCGAGVAFKLAWHFAKLWCNSDRVSETLQKNLINMLPLVALGTIADVVPLLGENRIMTAFGLRLIKKTPLTGLNALIEASKLNDEKIDSERVGFSLAPRLNACGRMGHAAEAVRLFTDATPDEARTIAQHLTQQNLERQKVERRIFDHAAQCADDAGFTRDDRRAIVLAHESWHPGVVGIVCSRMVERFGRPTILLNQNKPVCKGSARSIDGYSIYEGIAAGKDHLATFGGHAMAAGLSVLPDRLAAFTDAVVEHANRHIAVDQLTPSITVDCDASLEEMDLAAVQMLTRLSPFGRGNRPPTLLLRQAILAEAPRQMGDKGKHLSLRLRNGNGENQRWLRAIWWSAGERAGDFAPGMKLDLVVEPKLNTWQNNTNVEAQICDVRVAGDRDR